VAVAAIVAPRPQFGPVAVKEVILGEVGPRHVVTPVIGRQVDAA
jgi:hypothetical protein